MKKLLLSLAAVCTMSLAAHAESMTITWSQEGYANAADVTELVKAPVTISCAKGSSNNPPKYYNTGSALRLYGGNTMTVSVEDGYTIDSVVFTVGSSNAFNAATTVTNGTFANNTWTASGDDVTSFTITQGGSSGHVRIETMTINYTESLGDKQPAGIKWRAASMNAAIGFTTEFPPLTNPNKLAITYSSSDESVATISADGKVTLVGVGTTEITAISDPTDVYAKGTATYTLNVLPVANSVADMLSLCEKSGDAVYVAFRIQVMYANGLNNYAKDASTGAPILIYDNLNREDGAILNAGWFASYSPYDGIPEFKCVTYPTVTSVKEVVYPKYEEVTADLLNSVITVDATFDEATPGDKTSFTGTLASGQELTFYNQFEIESVPAGNYTVTCAVTTYKENVQVYPISYKIKAEISDNLFYPSDNALDWTCSEVESGVLDNPGYKAECVARDNTPVSITFNVPAPYNEMYYIHITDITGIEWSSLKKIPVSEIQPFFEEMFGSELVKGNVITIDPVESNEKAEPELFYYWFAIDGDINENDLQDIHELDVTVLRQTVGVDEINIENGETVYYNLQGVKVAEPANGVFVKVTNGKATKVIF